MPRLLLVGGALLVAGCLSVIGCGSELDTPVGPSQLGPAEEEPDHTHSADDSGDGGADDDHDADDN